MIIDTHCHLNMSEFNDDISDVIKRADEHDVKMMIVIGIDHPHNLRAIELAESYENIYATVGIHPTSVDDDQDIARVKSLLDHPKVLAVGECGLDFYWRKDNKEKQIAIFKEHIELAKYSKKPLVIHTRNSFKEAYDLLLPHKGEVTGVFHCFSSNLEDARKAIDLGFMIGMDGPITYKKNDVLKEIVLHVDLEHILVETDSPYMTPAPFRGKRNEPGYTHYVVEKIAEIKGLDVEIVKQITSSNARRLFQL